MSDQPIFTPDADKLGKLVGETARQLYAGGLDENTIYLFFLMGLTGFAKDCLRSKDKTIVDLKRMWDMVKSVGDTSLVVNAVDGLDKDIIKEAGREFNRWKVLSKGRPGGMVPIAKVKVGKA